MMLIEAFGDEEGVRDMRSWVRGQWIPFDAGALSQFLGDPLESLLTVKECNLFSVCFESH